MKRGVISLLAVVATSIPVIVTIHQAISPYPSPDPYSRWNSITSSYCRNTRAAATTPSCDPYGQPGTLNVNSSHLDENRWIPFDDDCQSPRLLEALLSDDPDEANIGDMQWSRNRTVVLFGDSVARENIAYFCELVGEKLERITWDHPFAPTPRPSQTPPPLATSSESPDALLRDPDANSALVDDWKPKSNIANGEQGHMAHVCRVQKWGLVLVQQFQYGMNQEDYWSFKPGYIPPGTFEDRLHALLHPIVRATIDAYQPSTRNEPDLVMINSALWDTARWVREDMRLERDTEAGLSRDRLDWYRARVRQAVNAVAKLYPASAISWTTHHYPTGNGPSDWFTAGMTQAAAGTKSSSRPGNTVLRLSELDAAVCVALSASYNHHSQGVAIDGAQNLKDVRINNWGRIMLGQEKHVKDALHQAMVPGGRLWADMMLFDLRKAVWESQQN